MNVIPISARLQLRLKTGLDAVRRVDKVELEEAQAAGFEDAFIYEKSVGSIFIPNKNQGTEQQPAQVCQNVYYVISSMRQP